jgi:agmatine/peptidylarginine deiminase
MITDPETTFLYLSDQFEIKYPVFFDRFIKLLNKIEIDYDFLYGTKDVWVRDYMPIQVSRDRFVQFKYDPGYIYDVGKEDTITDPEPVLKKIGITPEFCYDIVLDGGNVIKSKNSIIVTDFLYKYNPGFSRAELWNILKDKFEMERVIVIPHEPDDYTGHADGMVRFLDDGKILVNNYRGYSKTFMNELERALRVNHLTPIPFPYCPSNRKNKEGDNTAFGCYINFLRIGNKIIIPKFYLTNEKSIIGKIRKIFDGYDVYDLDCREIAEDGGVLNCIGWTVKKLIKDY